MNKYLVLFSTSLFFAPLQAVELGNAPNNQAGCERRSNAPGPRLKSVIQQILKQEGEQKVIEKSTWPLKKIAQTAQYTQKSTEIEQSKKNIHKQNPHMCDIY